MLLKGLEALRQSRRHLTFVALRSQGRFNQEGEPLDDGAKFQQAAAIVLEEVEPIHDMLQAAIGADNDDSYMPLSALRQIVQFERRPSADDEPGEPPDSCSN